MSKFPFHWLENKFGKLFCQSSSSGFFLNVYACRLEPDYGIRKIFSCGNWNLRNLSCGIWTPGLWNLEYTSRNPDPPKDLKFHHQRIRNPVPGIQNPESMPWNSEYKTILDSLIWAVKRSKSSCTL